MVRDRSAVELLTVRQVLEELGGVSRRTFYRWRELHLAPACIRLPNGELRVRRDVLDAWVEERAEEVDGGSR
ncbi:helix-turn-helix domain-containing protein [Streptomyces yokosukanensis]|uniref:helix-turn-helix transcriptional regulator n=1 Tax=Streptomyces TaxID=1883 RepID=UPI0011A023E1|nr:helix-turn-helix domain-containing protein [Streptomyces sp. BK340]TVZ85452.1 helix-turn-helix protein [Streptomyces sp. BK340]